MSTTTSVTGAYSSTIGTGAARTADKTFTMETFLKVLGAQMKSQNPMDPLKDNEFIGQMTQYQSLEQQTKLNTTMTNLMTNMQLTQGASLIGRTVTYTPDNSTTSVTGVVSGILLDPKAGMTVNVGGVQVSPSQITQVAAQ
ncbi:MAG: flagellar hook capping FlgD N-terminal domain-containing protein [Thermoleophilia bacterium]